jgi:predicted  nucleic acid-binding Zn-ribbon protein
MPGTGLTGDQLVAHCPYCRASSDPHSFHTQAQTEFARDVAINEALGGLDGILRDALRLDKSGKRTIDAGLLSIEMSLTPAQQTAVGRPVEEELRRDLTCTHCGLRHAVFGLAFWCPDCGNDLFLQHVREEFDVVRRILEVAPQRRAELGARVAARDIENALEDVVSIFEAVLKLICRSELLARGIAQEDVSATIESKVRNKFQNVGLAQIVFAEIVGRELLRGESSETIAGLSAVFEKRHPITHNLGVIDRKYMRRVESGEPVGREIRVSSAEVLQAIDVVEHILSAAYRPESGATVPQE